MTEAQVIDQLIRNVQAIRTDETRFDTDFVAANLHTIRATAIQLYHKMYKRISSLCFQTVELEYDKNIQIEGKENCISVYELPSYIQLDGSQDGISFIGNSENKSFRRIKSRAELSTLLKHKQLNPYNGRYIGVLTDNPYAECHASNKIAKLVVSLIYANPNDNVAYNNQVDNYPIPVDLIPMMTDELIKKYFGRMAAIPVDYSPNKTDNPTVVKNR